MKICQYFLILLFLSLQPFVILAQNKNERKFFHHRFNTISAGYGPGKIQWYNDFTPLAPIRHDVNVRKYSPSWQFGYERTYWLSSLLDIGLGFEHTTLTERSEETPTPYWQEFGEEHLVQSFLHFTTKLNAKFSEEKFNLFAGINYGTANFIFNGYARETSNSLGNIHADFCFQSGFSLKMVKRFSLQTKWLEGLTRYDYYEGLVGGTTTPFYDYYKYRTFIFSIQYRINEN